MNKKDITFAGIIPLIGGINIGASQALGGKLPEYLLSYDPFSANDSHYVNYLKAKKNWTGEYVKIDQIENYVPKKVDVVISCCPCAGLSSMSSTSSADNPTNDWMYKTAEYVLKEVSPKVFWGENAPRLASPMGRKVADKLYEIGKSYGYSLTLYSTESRIHGLSQSRPRTFYFFTKSAKAPIFPFYKREIMPIENILKKKVLKKDSMNCRANDNDPYEDPWVQYVMKATKSKTLIDLYNHMEKSENFLCMVADGRFGDSLEVVAEWFDSKGYDKAARKARHIKMKLDNNKGFWGHDKLIPKKSIPAFVGALPYVLINPFTEKYVSLREGLRIMGMPEDFELVGDNPVKSVNHICQNVSPQVAEDMMNGVIGFLNGDLKFHSSSYIKQSNKNGKIECLLKEDILTLDTFFDVQI